jgi:hypothetical protein
LLDRAAASDMQSQQLLLGKMKAIPLVAIFAVI